MLFTVSFHTIICKSGQNKYQMGHRFLLPEYHGGRGGRGREFPKEMARELVFGDELDGHL